MKKTLATLALATFALSSISCSAPSSGDRRYFHSPAPIASKTGLQVEHVR
jgi:hypothetical protein